jgi:oligoendopeptidase F
MILYTSIKTLIAKEKDQKLENIQTQFEQKELFFQTEFETISQEKNNLINIHGIKKYKLTLNLSMKIKV